MSDEERQKIKAWVENWKVTGEELDRMKWEELRAMDRETSVRETTMAFAVADEWRAMQSRPVDRPSGLVDQQFWFSKWPTRSI